MRRWCAKILTMLISICLVLDVVQRSRAIGGSRRHKQHSELAALSVTHFPSTVPSRHVDKSSSVHTLETSRIFKNASATGINSSFMLPQQLALPSLKPIKHAKYVRQEAAISEFLRTSPGAEYYHAFSGTNVIPFLPRVVEVNDNHGAFAYACYFKYSSTKPNYIRGLLALVWSWKQSASKYPFVVATVQGGMPTAVTMALKKLGALVATMPVPGVNRKAQGSSSWDLAWSKILVWQLTQYETILLLDTDALILRNVDEIFAYVRDSNDIGIGLGYQSSCQVKHGVQLCSGDGSFWGINTGVELIRPSTKIFNLLWEYGNKEHGCLSRDFSYTDQELIICAYGHRPHGLGKPGPQRSRLAQVGRMQHLPYIYNAQPLQCMETSEKQRRPAHISKLHGKDRSWYNHLSLSWSDAEVKIVHYYNLPFQTKPWELQLENTSGEPYYFSSHQRRAFGSTEWCLVQWLLRWKWYADSSVKFLKSLGVELTLSGGYTM